MFVSLQDSTQNLEDGEVMNGVQTELLKSPKTKDALRYSLHVNGIFSFSSMFVSLIVYGGFYFMEKIKIIRITEQNLSRF